MKLTTCAMNDIYGNDEVFIAICGEESPGDLHPDVVTLRGEIYGEMAYIPFWNATGLHVFDAWSDYDEAFNQAEREANQCTEN